MSLEERIKYAEMKARHAKQLRPWYKKWWGASLIILLAFVLIILIISSLYVAERVKQIRQEGDQAYIAKQRQIYSDALNGPGNNHYLGGANAEVIVIEFADFACPFCQETAPEVRQAAEKYGNRIKIIFRDYPLHDSSITLALAGRCAGEQGKFWPMHDLLFQNQAVLSSAGDNLSAALMQLAQSLELNTDNFTACLDNQKYLDQIKRDFDDAEILGIEGTPTWFVNNYQITGAMPEGRFLEMLSGLLETN